MNRRRVYLFSHHHLSPPLLAKYVDEARPDDILLCRENVAEYYGRFVKRGSNVRTFKFPRHLRFLPIHVLAQLPLRFLRPQVELVCTNPVGLQVLLAMSRYRVGRLSYVDLAEQFPKLQVQPPSLLWRIYLAILSVLLGRRIGLSEWGGVVEFDIQGGVFDPPAAPVPAMSKVEHGHDLIVLDFSVAALPIDEAASLERIRDFISGFRSAAVKIHPNYPGDAGHWLSLPEIPAHIPAEALAHPDVHCLVLVSSAAKAFTELTSLLSLLVFRSPSERVAFEESVRAQFAAQGDLPTFHRALGSPRP